jgi:chromosome segregation ATPase
MNKEVKVIQVVDIESDIVKELLIFKIKSLRDSLELISQKIETNEHFNKELKREIHQVYDNAKYLTQTLSDKEKRKLDYRHRIIDGANLISMNQSRRQGFRKNLAVLYKEKTELKKQIAYYNAIADAYEIKLYKK